MYHHDHITCPQNIGSRVRFTDDYLESPAFDHWRARADKRIDALMDAVGTVVGHAIRQPYRAPNQGVTALVLVEWDRVYDDPVLREALGYSRTMFADLVHPENLRYIHDEDESR